MRKIYEILANRDKETRLLYKEWSVSSDFPVPNNFTSISPPKEYERERFDFTKSRWVEDDYLDVREELEVTEKRNDILEMSIREVKQRSDMVEEALLELATMIIRL